MQVLLKWPHMTQFESESRAMVPMSWRPSPRSNVAGKPDDFSWSYLKNCILYCLYTTKWAARRHPWQTGYQGVGSAGLLYKGGGAGSWVVQSEEINQIHGLSRRFGQKQQKIGSETGMVSSTTIVWTNGTGWAGTESWAMAGVGKSPGDLLADTDRANSALRAMALWFTARSSLSRKECNNLGFK